MFNTPAADDICPAKLASPPPRPPEERPSLFRLAPIFDATLDICPAASASPPAAAVALDARDCMGFPAPPRAPVTPASAPLASAAKVLAEAVIPFSPLPMPPPSLETASFTLFFKEANCSPCSAVLAESAADDTCCETD